MSHLRTSLTDVLMQLPSKEQREVLISAYMKGHHALRPIFHGPSFLHEVRAFQAGQKQGDCVVSPHFLSLYVAVLFAGSVACARARLRTVFGDRSRETLSSTLYTVAIRTLRLCDFPQSPSLQSLSAFLIVNSTWLREEQPLVCCSFVGVAVRVAQIVGLHREPSNFPHVGGVEAHVRRQVWWSLVAIDVQVAFASGLPPLIQSRLYDVKLIGEAGEDFLCEEHSTDSQSTSSIIGTFASGEQAFHQKASELLHCLHGRKLSPESVDYMLGIVHKIEVEIDRYKEQILSIERALCPYRSSRHDDGTAPLPDTSNTQLAQFTRTVLSMLAIKPYTIMYGALRRHNLLLYLFEKEPRTIMHCREYLLRFLRLTQCEDFQPWHWCWPGVHQPLHSILALIANLEAHPHDDLAAATRQSVDLALSMSRKQQDSGGIYRTRVESETQDRYTTGVSKLGYISEEQETGVEISWT